MAKNKTHTNPYRRKSEGKTDYHKRLKLLTSNKSRIVIRNSLNKITIQAIDFNEKGDKVIGNIDSTELRKHGWKASTGNIPAAYLTGLLFGKKFKSKLKDTIIDLGIRSITYRSKISATIKGLADSGLNINYNEKIIPTQEDIEGKTIAKFASELSKDNERYNKQFSAYLKNNIKPEDLPQMFEAVKAKI